jgi:hypothetical protein
MSKLEIVLPAIVLALSFMMKLFVDRTPNIPIAIQTTYELPIDIVFLALTFAAAFVIIKPGESGRGIVHFAVYVGISVLAIVLARRSNRFFDRNRWLLSAALFVFNLVIALSTLVISMKLVSGK